MGQLLNALWSLSFACHTARWLYKVPGYGVTGLAPSRALAYKLQGTLL